MARKNSSASEAYEYIFNQIVNMNLQPGMPVIEQQIADQLGISRTPVREAIRKLEAEGLLTSLPYQGTLVANMTSEDVYEICDLRTMMELWALKRSLPEITKEDLDRCETLFREAEQPFDPQKYYEADRAFHRLITDKARSRRLDEMLEILNRQTDRFRQATTMTSARFDESYREHMELIRFMREKDYTKCRNLLEKHLSKVADGFVKALKESRYIRQ